MLLRRQLRKLGLSEETPPDAAGWRKLLECVGAAYAESEQDRYTLERSLMISSGEMQELYGGLRRSAANFSIVVERSPSMVFVYTAEDLVTRYANATLLDTLGFDASEILGKVSLDVFVHREDRPKLVEYRERRAAGEDVRPARVRWVRRDGTSLAVDATAVAITYDAQAAMLVFGTDVTEQLRKEELLRVSEERHRLLFEKSPLSIMLFDPESFRLLAVNDAAVQLYGYSRAELLAMRLTDFKLPEDVPDLARSMDEVRAGRAEPSFHATKRHRKKDGTIIDVQIASHPLTVEGRIALLAIGADVTETRKLEEQLRQAHKMDAIGRLAGGVAHDFNNMLGVVLADTHWIKDHLGAEHPLYEDVVEVERVAQRAASLTRQLLAFSRQQVLEPRVLALNALVSNLEKMLRRIIGEDVTFDVRLDPRLGSVRADPGQVEQIIMNLVVNARDAMLDGGRLVIETANVELDERAARNVGRVAAGSYVMVSVQDTGCGMAPATISHVFEPFFTTKGVGKGTGLGLATVFGIVEQSNGAIDVSSEVGKGTTFRVYLPRIDAHPSSRELQAVKAPAKSSGRILLVEDDPDLRRVTKRLLTARGYTVVAVDGATSALEQLTGGLNIDLVLTDVVMPGLDGFALADRIHETHPGLPIVFMSGYSSHNLLSRSETDGKLLQKPFSSEDLALAVRSALKSAA